MNEQMDDPLGYQMSSQIAAFLIELNPSIE